MLSFKICTLYQIWL